MTTIAEQVERAPVTSAIAAGYVGMAFVTGPVYAEYTLLIEYGSKTAILLFDEPWRLVTSAFLHGGLIHLLLNLSCLVVFGPMLERSLGTIKYIALYVIAAMSGGVWAMLWADHALTTGVGGSGALFGMFGAYLAISMRSGRHLFDAFQFAGPRAIVTMTLMNLVIGFLIPFVSNAAHIGGLVGGFVLTFVFLDRGRHGSIDAIGRIIQVAWIALFASLVLYSMDPVGHQWRASLQIEMHFNARDEVEEHYAEAPPAVRRAAIAWHERLH